MTCLTTTAAQVPARGCSRATLDSWRCHNSYSQMLLRLAILPPRGPFPLRGAWAQQSQPPRRGHITTPGKGTGQACPTPACFPRLLESIQRVKGTFLVP